ncbi:MAG: hypothetical protein H0X29_07225 [Parachlamydiaceae bacterium]|nr:hypothetical protein [Parachlamydiaceae bacterium]
MSIFSKWRIFQKVAVGVLITFIGLMVLVCIAAYTRPSGSTRQDMAKAQFVRFKAVHKKSVGDLAGVKGRSSELPK